MSQHPLSSNIANAVVLVGISFITVYLLLNWQSFNDYTVVMLFFMLFLPYLITICSWQVWDDKKKNQVYDITVHKDKLENQLLESKLDESSLRVQMMKARIDAAERRAKTKSEKGYETR